MQLDVNLDIEKWIREHLNVDYNFQINVYKDVVRDKFLIYDYMELTKSNWENTERKQLVAHRFFYINNKEEIEKRLQEDFYVFIVIFFFYLSSFHDPVDDGAFDFLSYQI